MKIQNLGCLVLIWNFLTSNFWTIEDINKMKGAPSLNNKIYLLLKEILIIFYNAKYNDRMYSSDVDIYSFNLSSLALNYKFYHETIYLTKLYLWIFYISDENNETSNEQKNQHIDNWFQGVECSLKLADYEKKILSNFKNANENIISIFINRVNALLNIKTYEEVECFVE